MLRLSYDDPAVTDEIELTLNVVVLKKIVRLSCVQRAFFCSAQLEGGAY